MPPPNTPEEGLPGVVPLSSRTTSSSRRSSQSVVRHVSAASVEDSPEKPETSIEPIDYQALEYLETVDETLICPICRTPFHVPVTANKCGHTFCESCLRTALRVQALCPLDREPLTFQPESLYGTRIIAHQLDRLIVKCPNRPCEFKPTRNLLESHYERQCPYTMVPCPEDGCDKKVRRQSSDPGTGCLHYEMDCFYCRKRIQAADQEEHYEMECSQHVVKCGHCNEPVVRFRLSTHEAKECANMTMQCQWHSLGCRVSGKRDVVTNHQAQGCVYEAISKLARERAEDRLVLEEVRNQVVSLNGRLRQLESEEQRWQPPSHPEQAWHWRMRSGVEPHLATATTHDVESSSPRDPGGGDGGPAAPEAATPPFDARDDYMLALQFERMELRVEELRKALNEMDGRHSTMLLNEALPIKEQIAEMRSNLGVLNMHTTWLMNFQRRNRVNTSGPSSPSVVPASSTGSTGSSRGADGERRDDGAAGGSTLSALDPLRRLSDTLRENPPRL